MKDPIKIIHKFKNNNKKIQYKVYIFIGSIVPENIQKILNSIKDKSFITTLKTISNKDFKELELYYGEYWYKHFFISYHLNNEINIINSSPSKKKEIIANYSKEWYNKHFEDVTEKKIIYSYATSYYNYNVINNKIKNKRKKNEIDFRTHNFFKIQDGGHLLEPIDDDDLNINDDDDDDFNLDKSINENKDENDEDFEVLKDEIEDEKYQEEIEDYLDIDNITKLYTTLDIENSKSINETSKLISEAFNIKWNKDIINFMPYDESLDNININNKLEDVYVKYYINEQYIFKDDTIKTMRNKISVSIPISKKFGENMVILPECQYLWSEYKINNISDFVMIGQKWILKNELLKFDIVPNENLNIYEKLKNNLLYLKNSFTHKLKREDDENNIIRFYDNYFTNNEIFLLDIYNELGVDYNSSKIDIKNLYDVYINLYYPLISYERLEQIIDLLNNKNTKELQYIELNYGTIKNDNKLEIEIEKIVEKAKIDISKYDSLFFPNYIIQSIIHLNIQDPKNITGTFINNKFNLYKIFDNYIVNETYPFIQYKQYESQVVYKFYTKLSKLENEDFLNKWFDNTPNKIFFKIKIDSQKYNINYNDKYLAVNFYETGRIEYKLTWKENDEATINDITMSYNIINDLLKKINLENNNIKIIIPDNSKFKYAFINTIQQFKLPNKTKINHNDLSDFSRLFYIYVSLVIEPKKRLAKKKDKVDTISKYGTYLRFKRINKYDNRTKMHLRILYFLRNYDISDKEITDEISKQFNITLDSAAKELDFVKMKFNKIVTSSKKILKTLKVLPKSKPPGIGIDIQGRDVEKYKIRITGARNKEQLDEIVDFMKVLIFLYIETYINKNSEYNKLKHILKTLNKIAKRRNKVNDIVDYTGSTNNVKTITSLDKSRLGFKPEKGQNQWTRSCQNSGTVKKRPNIIPDDKLSDLIKEGYKLNKKTGFYEKKVDIKIRGTDYNTTIKAIKLQNDDNKYNFFTCDPSHNNEYMHIGFLSKSNNPNDLCMPCCYKKDFLESNNTEKRDYFLKCVNEDVKPTNELETFKVPVVGDKLYILQETNKIQTDRYILLPKHLDLFFNKLWNNDSKIINHYLYESNSGYFFKYTIKHDYYYFLIAISNIYEISIPNIIDKIIKFLESDVSNKIFSYLNSGDISKIFNSREKFIDYIKKSNYLEYNLIGELISIPGVLSHKGINFYIFNKEIITINKVFEKEVIKEKYILDCLNLENSNDYYLDRDVIILIKENKFYFPIYMVLKTDKMKKIQIIKYFDQTNQKKIIDELKSYYEKSGTSNIINNIIYNYNLIAKNLIIKFEKANIKINNQYIDERYKCQYLELDNGLLLPVLPSGISYRYKFTKIKQIKSKLLNLDNTIKLLIKIENILKLKYIPKIVFYDKIDNNKINITSILLENNLIIKIINEFIDKKIITNKSLIYSFQSLEETIDFEIINYNEDEQIYNEKTKIVKSHYYYNESYYLYKLELSNYLRKNDNIKKIIINIVRDENLDKIIKKKKLRKILFEILDHKLYKKYKKDQNDNSKSILKDKEDTISYINKNIPDLKNYIYYNIRNYCETNKNENSCNTNLHCMWKNNNCKLQLIEDYAINYVNKVIEEMLLDNIKFNEIIQENNYFVSDIIDYTQYTNRVDQKIIKSSNFNINKLLSELFGKDNVPTIGKRYINKYQINVENEYPELEILGKQYIQEIVSNKDSIIRAYVNSYYWINNSLYDIDSRNLGYISEFQTMLTYLFKANVIDYIQDVLNKSDNDEIKKFISIYFNNRNDNLFESSLNNFRKSSFNTSCIIELYILSFLYPYAIVVYDNYLQVKYLFLQGQIEVTNENIKKLTSDKNYHKTIYIKINLNNTNIPTKIFSIYYL